MLKELLIRTLDKVRALGAGEVCTLTVEEAGVLQAYLQAHERRSRGSLQEGALLDRIRAVLAAWEAIDASPPQAPRPSGPEKRTQRVLRAAIDKLLKRAYGDLSRGEVLLARATLDTLSRLNTPSADQTRLTRILQEVLRDYDLHLETQTSGGSAPPDAGTPADEVSSPFEVTDVETEAGFDAPSAIAAQGQVSPVITAASYAGVERKVYETLSGIPVSFSARGLELHGDVEVNGDVPDDVLIVVREGGVVVRGYVFGYVAADGDIVVHGNVQGAWLVSAGGDIAAERVLSGGRVIAQRGNVSCAASESPERLFAGGTLAVHGDVTGGVLAARCMDIEGTVTGAEVHVAGPLRAQRFAADPRRGTTVFLRGVLTSQDYGLPLSESVIATKRAIAKHAYQAAVAWRAITHLQQDVGNCRRAMLYYLLAGSDNNVAIRHLRALQTQSVLFDRIVTMGASLRGFLHAARETGGIIAAREIVELAEENLRILKGLSRDIAALPGEYGAAIREPLAQAAKHLGAISKRIVASARAELEVSVHLESLDAQLEKWQAASAACGEKVSSLVQELGLELEAAAKIEGDSSELEPMLANVLADARGSPQSEQARRSRSPVMRLLESTLERHRENITVWREGLDGALLEQQGLTAKLAEGGTILFGDSRPGGTYVRAGYFSEGVVIASTPERIAGTDTAKGKVIRIQTPIETGAVFTLEKGLVLRAPSDFRTQ